MATTLSILAMRSAAFSACLRPSSERWSPAARPGSFTPVVGVRPWRTRSTTVEGRGRFAFMRRWRLAQHDAELAQRVLHGVHDGGRAGDGAALAHALDTEGIDDRAVLGEG